MLSYFLERIDNEEERELFTDLYLKYEKKMYFVAMRFLRSHEQAEDAVHDSFEKILKNISKIHEIPCQELEPWIVIIVKNTVRDMLRRQKRELAINPMPVVQDSLESEADYHALREQIHNLPEIYREALELKYILGWNHKQIGRQLGITESAVAARIMRGRKMLKKKLALEMRP